MTPPLVSVLIPAYNAERWIGEALASAMGQTYPNVEVIVVDDGSTDGTLEAARQHAGDRIRVYAQANAGACAARNHAMSKAGGDYFQFLDADDLLGPTKIERQVERLRSAPADVLAACGTVYFKDGAEPGSGRHSAGTAALDSDDPVEWLLRLWTPGNGLGMVSAHAWLVPRQVAERAGPWDEALSQDQDGEYFTRALMASAGVRWDPQARVFYRKFEVRRSVSGGYSERHLTSRLRAAVSKTEHLLPRVGEGDRPLAASLLARQFRSVAFQAYPRYPSVYRAASERAAELSTGEQTFYGNTRLRHVERLLGWKTAKLLSTAFHRMTGAAG